MVSTKKKRCYFFSSQDLTAELLGGRKALLADITALRALFQEKLRAGNTTDIKRVGTLLKGNESICRHMLLAQGRLESSTRQRDRGHR